MDVILKSTFSVVDYCVFGATMLVSIIIGIYFAYGGKQNNTKTYLMAGRDMHWFPVSLSLLVTNLSGITLIGVPSEIYTYGLQYVNLCFSYLLLIAITAIIFAPFFFRLQVVSSNEYLERRFSPGLRSLGCFLASLQYIIFLSVVLYAPSLALEAVSGIPLTATIITTGLVCTFYTTLGGMKAVIWTDVFQASIMFTAMLVVAICGTLDVGGFSEVVKRIQDGERDNFFDFTPDPRIRNSFWTLAIGGAFTVMPGWTACQPAVQRFQACKSVNESRKAVLVNIPSLLILFLLCVFDGAVIYAVYANCDIGVYGLNVVTSNDQILPYFIIHKLGMYKGLPGLFISAMFSGALSTASSGMNSIAAMGLEDIVKKIKPNISDKVSTLVSKVISCCLGFSIIGLAFLISTFGPRVLQLTFSIFGIIGGPYLGLFFLGMMVPWANWKGAYCGIIVGVSSTFWLVSGAQMYPPNTHPQVVKMTNCSASVWNTTYWKNGTIPENLIIYPEEDYASKDTGLSSWYHMSYLWYGAIGMSFTFVVGCLFSILFNALGTGRKEEKVPDELLFDYEELFYTCLPRKIFMKCFGRRASSLVNGSKDEPLVRRYYGSL